MCICGNCGKLIEENYYFCPWCGKSQVEAAKNENSDLRLRQKEEVIKDTRYDKIERMEEVLDELEKELSVLVLSNKMHG